MRTFHPFTRLSSKYHSSLFYAALLGLYSMAPAFAQIDTLVNFNGANGNSPYTGLTLSADGSTLYGTTVIGGANNGGTVFSESVSGGAVDTLVSFSTSSGNLVGYNPESNLLLSSDGSTLYGTNNSGGGTGAAGTVYSVNVSTGVATSLTTFAPSNFGAAYPVGNIILSSDGSTLYGTGSGGGLSFPDGAVYSVPTAGGASTTLASFSRSTVGYTPQSGLTLSASGTTFYGTTSGGANGSIFSVPVAGGAITTLANFNGTNGSLSYSALTLSTDGGTLFGVTRAGGANGDGEIFSMSLTSNIINVLYSFNGTDGDSPWGALTLSADGSTLFGTTWRGGTDNDGTVFSYSLTGNLLTSLASFDGTDGSKPMASLTLSGDGTTLFGTTSSGGTSGDGTIFSVSTTAVPEPSTWALLLGALGLLVSGQRRHRRA